MGFEQVQRFILGKKYFEVAGTLSFWFGVVVQCCLGLFHSKVSLTAIVHSKCFTPLYFKVFPLAKMLLFYTRGQFIIFSTVVGPWFPIFLSHSLLVFSLERSIRASPLQRNCVYPILLLALLILTVSYRPISELRKWSSLQQVWGSFLQFISQPNFTNISFTYYYALKSLSLFWSAESVQWIFLIGACDAIELQIIQ